MARHNWQVEPLKVCKRDRHTRQPRDVGINIEYTDRLEVLQLIHDNNGENAVPVPAGTVLVPHLATKAEALFREQLADGESSVHLFVFPLEDLYGHLQAQRIKIRPRATPYEMLSQRVREAIDAYDLTGDHLRHGELADCLRCNLAKAIKYGGSGNGMPIFQDMPPAGWSGQFHNRKLITVFVHRFLRGNQGAHEKIGCREDVVSWEMDAIHADAQGCVSGIVQTRTMRVVAIDGQLREITRDAGEWTLILEGPKT